MSSIANIGLRAAQVLFGVIVLGLSISLIKGQYFSNTLPPLLPYAAFTGGFGLLTGLIGIASVFVEPLAGLVMAVVDGLTAIFYLAGGIAIAVKLKGISCTSHDLANEIKLSFNELLNGGCVQSKQGLECGYTAPRDVNTLTSRCQMSEADAAFMFISFIVLLGAITLTFLHLKKK